MKHGASVALVEKGHGAFGGYVERFGKLHDDASYFAPKNMVFHKFNLFPLPSLEVFQSNRRLPIGCFEYGVRRSV